MRSWAGRLHGGQLIILLAFLGAFGFGVSWIGYEAFLITANKEFALSADLAIGSPMRSIAQDTAMATIVRKQALSQSNVAFALIGIGLLAWALAIPLLWWWFGARQAPSDRGVDRHAN